MEKNIYLTRYHNGIEVSRNQVNEPVTGGNQIKPQIAQISFNQLMVCWEDETGISNQVIDMNGQPGGEVMRLGTKAFQQLPNFACLAVYNSFFKIYDLKDWSVMHKDTLRNYRISNIICILYLVTCIQHRKSNIHPQKMNPP